MPILPRVRLKRRHTALHFLWWTGYALIFIAISFSLYHFYLRAVERTLEGFQQSIRMIATDMDHQMRGVDTGIRLLGVEAEHYLDNDNIRVDKSWFATLVERDGLFYTSRPPDGVPPEKSGYLFGKNGIPNPDSHRAVEMAKALALTPLLGEAQRRILGASWVYYVSMEGFTNLYPFTEGIVGKVLWEDDAMGGENLSRIRPQSNPAPGVHWMEAYIDPADKGVVVTVITPVYDRQNTYRAFVATDFALGNLKPSLNPVDLADGEFYIVNQPGQILLTSRQVDMNRVHNLDEFLPDALLASANSWLIEHETGCDRLEDWYLCRQEMSEVPWQVLFVADRGSVIWRSVMSMRVEIVSLFLLILGIAAFERDRRLAEKQREWGRRYQRILDSSDQGFGEWYIQERTFSASPRFDILFGRSHQALGTQEDWMSHIHPEDVAGVRRSLRGYLSGHSPLSVATFRVRTEDGSWRWLMAHGKVVEYDRRGRPEIVTGTLTDITEQKESEAALLVAKQVAERAREAAESANIAKSRFLATASHDLRQPVQAGNLLLSTLKRSELNAEQGRIVHSLELATRSLDELLDALLDISRLDAGTITPHIEPVEIYDIFQRIDGEFAALALEKKLRFKFFFPDRPLFFPTDMGIFMRVLRNLIGNAIRYTQEGGVLVGVRLRTKENGRFLLFQVWDTGIGIREEDQGRIFEEFFQVDNASLSPAQRHGLGLGLAITKRMTELMGYTIRCQSRYGRGSLFEVLVPLPQEELENVSRIRHSIDPDDYGILRGRFCILTEDDPLVSEAFSVWLESCGMRCLCFSDGDSALSSPEIHNADFFITDFRIQGKLNGIDLLKILHERIQRPIRGIIVTGGASRARIVSAAHNISNWPILYKPVTPERLLQAMLQICQDQPFETPS
ncbi:MAG: PAS domain-containing protein [Zoogloeaceae bacterium]|jgi:PAS domain S-box-containing protein|nr:PAS domain-containing protein [Zoogloeaceae bacterium]